MENSARALWTADDWAAYKQNCDAQRDGITTPEVVDIYTELGQNNLYEKALSSERYNGPAFASEAVAELFPKDRENVNILDIAAGTGFVGERLRKFGFKHIDALEPSLGMIQKAQEKGVYDKYIMEVLDEKKLPIAEDIYDCSIICGAFNRGHIPCSGIKEVIRITKPGGFICIVMGLKYLHEYEEYTHLEPMMDQYEKAGKWTRIGRDVRKNYVFDLDGVVFKYQVL